jgi:hypothetical protein
MRQDEAPAGKPASAVRQVAVTTAIVAVGAPAFVAACFAMPFVLPVVAVGYGVHSAVTRKPYTDKSTIDES